MSGMRLYCTSYFFRLVFYYYVGYRHNVVALSNCILCNNGNVLERILKLYGWNEQYGEPSYIISGMCIFI